MADQFSHLLSANCAGRDEKIGRFSLTPHAENVLQANSNAGDHREKATTNCSRAKLNFTLTNRRKTRASLSYRELDSRSNRLANYLRAAASHRRCRGIYGHRSVSLSGHPGRAESRLVFLIRDPDYPVD
jgi:non-ribosomal peptide synthetase component F